MSDDQQASGGGSRSRQSVDEVLDGFAAARRPDPPVVTAATAGEDVASYHVAGITSATRKTTPPPEASVMLMATPAPLDRGAQERGRPWRLALAITVLTLGVLVMWRARGAVPRPPVSAPSLAARDSAQLREAAKVEGADDGPAPSELQDVPRAAPEVKAAHPGSGPSKASGVGATGPAGRVAPRASSSARPREDTPGARGTPPRGFDLLPDEP